MVKELNIKALRRQKGIKQEQLADAVGVSPQAVSKWESGGMPDTALLPAIADYLDVSIDELFGRKSENISFYDSFLKYFANVPLNERILAFYDLFRLVGASFCGCERVDGSLYELAGEESFSQVETNEGYFQCRLGKGNAYALIVPEFESGYKNAVPYCEEYTKLFGFLSEPSSLKAMYLLGTHNGVFFNAETLTAELDISKEEADKVISDLLGFGFIRKAELQRGKSSEPIYQCKTRCEFVSFMYFTQVLLNLPHQFAYRCSDRDKPYFTKE